MMYFIKRLTYDIFFKGSIIKKIIILIILLLIVFKPNNWISFAEENDEIIDVEIVETSIELIEEVKEDEIMEEEQTENISEEIEETKEEDEVDTDIDGEIVDEVETSGIANYESLSSDITELNENLILINEELKRIESQLFHLFALGFAAKYIFYITDNLINGSGKGRTV